MRLKMQNNSDLATSQSFDKWPEAMYDAALTRPPSVGVGS